MMNPTQGPTPVKRPTQGPKTAPKNSGVTATRTRSISPIMPIVGDGEGLEMIKPAGILRQAMMAKPIIAATTCRFPILHTLTLSSLPSVGTTFPPDDPVTGGVTSYVFNSETGRGMDECIT